MAAVLVRTGILAAVGSTAACLDTAVPAADGPVPTRHSYGEDPSQFGELHLPDGPGPFPVVVVVHGGFWRAAYDLSLGTPLAVDLAGRGYAAWNLEYRRVGDGGGWPTTFEDVAAGIDRLASLVADGSPLDLTRVVALGHSAGGHLAAWAAARPGLPTGSPGAGPAVSLTGVVAQAGVLDLRLAAEHGLGADATQEFLGGGPDDVPDRYAVASPVQRLPLGVPVICVHGEADTNVPPSQSRSYVEAATAAGDDAELRTVAGDHFVLIDVGSAAWQTVVGAVGDLT